MKKIKYLFDDILIFLKNNKLIFMTIFIIIVISLFCKTSVKAVSDDINVVYELTESTNFDGSSISVDTGVPQSILLNDYSIAIDFTVYDWYSSGHPGLFGLHSDLAGLIGFQRNGSSIVFGFNRGGELSFNIKDFPVAQNLKLVVSYNKTTNIHYVYLNGVLIGSGSIGVPNVLDDNIIIGRSFNSGDRFFNGIIRTFKIYDKFFNSSEIEGLFNNSLVSLKLSVNTTELTEFGVVIKTQTFSDEFLKTHKLYYSYPLADGSNSKYMICDDGVTDGLTVDNYYRVWATSNGVYKFRLTDLDDNVICSATMNITNIIESTQSATDNSVLLPILSYSIDKNNYVVVKTQNLSKDLINRYRCYFGSDVKTSGNKGALELVAQEGDNNTFYFKASTDVDDTFYFQFYDTEVKKFSTTVSITINVESAIAGASNDTQPKTMGALLKQKFGIFYSGLDFLEEFWNVITNKNPECPNFSITLPEFCGGGTYNIFDFQFYNQYRDYVHYIIAGFCYFFFIKRLIADIPKII